MGSMSGWFNLKENPMVASMATENMSGVPMLYKG